jgi:hypothetical protein
MTPIDRPDDLAVDKDGSIRVRAGARMLVRLTVINNRYRFQVALSDLLPAGFEPIDPQLRNSEKTSRSSSVAWWIDHVNLRNDRVELFADWLHPGVFEYEFLVRATTRGDFIHPPARVEQMYSPEVYGQTAGGRIKIR